MTEQRPDPLEHPDLKDLQPPDTSHNLDERAAAGIEILSAEPLVLLENVPVGSTLHVVYAEGDSRQTVSFLRTATESSLPEWRVRQTLPSGDVRERSARVHGSVLPTSSWKGKPRLGDTPFLLLKLSNQKSWKKTSK